MLDVDEAWVARDVPITFDGVPSGGTVSGRTIPEEPMAILLNVDVSTRWGWLNQFDNCTDCRDPACVAEDRPNRDLLLRLCEMLPVAYEIDHVRVWQRRGDDKASTSCDPPGLPTNQHIQV